MNEEKLGLAINRGNQAALELERTNEAFDTLREQYIKAWEEAPLRDAEGRERLWQAVQIVGKVRSHLANIVANGRVAEADVRRLRTGKTGIFS